MIIDKDYARALIEEGDAELVGRTWNDGYLWACLTNFREARTDHFGPLTPDDPEFFADFQPRSETLQALR